MANHTRPAFASIPLPAPLRHGADGRAYRETAAVLAFIRRLKPSYQVRRRKATVW